MQNNLPKYILTKENSLREDPAGNITFVAQAMEVINLHSADAKTAWAECEALREKVAALEAALSAAEPVARQYRAGSTEGKTGWRMVDDEHYAGWEAMKKRFPDSVTLQYRDLYAAPTAPSVAVKALHQAASDFMHLFIQDGHLTMRDLEDTDLIPAYEKLSAALSAQVQDVAEGKELDRFELWFFHHLSDDQRTALFALAGYPTTGMNTHGKQKIALKHWFSRLPAAPAKQEGGHD